ncbi:MAG TPA: DEAD/DEAH box helicase family protein [Chthoniobacterales bacterium]|jgi:superfamily II DNA or RNA helicase|nr:DEAD/DEAH box helicase family protein [Chthoniobacterales bacterium]
MDSNHDKVIHSHQNAVHLPQQKPHPPSFEMELRSYQKHAVSQTLKCWTQFDRLLGVAAVGAGKTIIASGVIQARLPEGPALFSRIATSFWTKHSTS